MYSAELVDWSKQFSPQFRKFTLVMHFRIGTDVIPGWFNIEPSDSKTTIKAGWKSNFLRMYQACLDKRLDRRDRISMRPFEPVSDSEVGDKTKAEVEMGKKSRE